MATEGESVLDTTKHSESPSYSDKSETRRMVSMIRSMVKTKCEAERFKLLTVTSKWVRMMSVEALQNCEDLSSVLQEVVQLAIPPALPDRGHFIFEKEDFEVLSDKTKVVLIFINSVLEKCNHGGVSDPWPVHQCLPDLLLVLSANMRSNLWTTDSVQKLTLQVLNQLRMVYKVDCLSGLLQLDVSSRDREAATPRSCLLGRYLGAVRARLTQENWQANPTFVESFVWMLTQMMKFPHVGEYLDMVMAPALLLTDSHVTQQKVLGIHCLHHITANVTREQLRWYGRADVVYAALKQQLFSREQEILGVLLPALLTLLPIIDTSPAPGPSQTDAVLSQVLVSAMTESGLVLRRLYTQHIPDLVRCLGLASVRHLARLLELVDHYLEVCDPPEETARLNALKVAHALMTHAWPRLTPHADRLTTSLLQLLLELDSRHSTAQRCAADHLTDRALACLRLLADLCPGVHACLQEVAVTPELSGLWLRVQRSPGHGCWGEEGVSGVVTGSSELPSDIQGGSGKEGVTGVNGSSELPSGKEGVTGVNGSSEMPSGKEGVTGVNGSSELPSDIQGGSGKEGVTGVNGSSELPSGKEGVSGVNGSSEMPSDIQIGSGKEGVSGVNGSSELPSDIQGGSGKEGISGVNGSSELPSDIYVDTPSL